MRTHKNKSCDNIWGISQVLSVSWGSHSDKAGIAIRLTILTCVQGKLDRPVLLNNGMSHFVRVCSLDNNNGLLSSIGLQGGESLAMQHLRWVCHHGLVSAICYLQVFKCSFINTLYAFKCFFIYTCTHSNVCLYTPVCIQMYGYILNVSFELHVISVKAMILLLSFICVKLK